MQAKHSHTHALAITHSVWRPGSSSLPAGYRPCKRSRHQSKAVTPDLSCIPNAWIGTTSCCRSSQIPTLAATAAILAPWTGALRKAPGTASSTSLPSKSILAHCCPLHLKAGILILLLACSTTSASSRFSRRKRPIHSSIPAFYGPAIFAAARRRAYSAWRPLRLLPSLRSTSGNPPAG